MKADGSISQLAGIREIPGEWRSGALRLSLDIFRLRGVLVAQHLGKILLHLLMLVVDFLDHHRAMLAQVYLRVGQVPSAEREARSILAAR